MQQVVVMTQFPMASYNKCKCRYKLKSVTNQTNAENGDTEFLVAVQWKDSQNDYKILKRFTKWLQNSEIIFWDTGGTNKWGC